MTRRMIFQYSIGDAGLTSLAGGATPRCTFNTPLEMPGVLVFGFCGFLSFCVGVCGFLRRLVGCGCFGFVLARRERRCGCLRVFFSSASACAEELHDVLKTPRGVAAWRVATMAAEGV